MALPAQRLHCLICAQSCNLSKLLLEPKMAPLLAQPHLRCSITAGWQQQTLHCLTKPPTSPLPALHPGQAVMELATPHLKRSKVSAGDETPLRTSSGTFITGALTQHPTSLLLDARVLELADTACRLKGRLPLALTEATQVVRWGRIPDPSELFEGPRSSPGQCQSAVWWSWRVWVFSNGVGSACMHAAGCVAQLQRLV
jgi:hypothetical protein